MPRTWKWYTPEGVIERTQMAHAELQMQAELHRVRAMQAAAEHDEPAYARAVRRIERLSHASARMTQIVIKAAALPSHVSRTLH